MVQVVDLIGASREGTVYFRMSWGGADPGGTPVAACPDCDDDSMVTTTAFVMGLVLLLAGLGAIFILCMIVCWGLSVGTQWAERHNTHRV
jgi:hypothetical protein